MALRLEALTAEQRGWLEEAAADAAARSAALADKDAYALGDACGSGARFAEASAADLAALEAAFAPVYAKLEQHPETRAFIERIQELKESSHAEPVLSIPADCTGSAPGQATGDTGTAPASLNGTYRYVITLDEARKAGMVDPEEAYPLIITVTLKDGRMEDGPGEAGTTYTVADDQVTFYVPAWGYSLTFTFSVDDDGDLHLTPVLPMDPGDQFVWATHPWTKID